MSARGTGLSRALRVGVLAGALLLGTLLLPGTAEETTPAPAARSGGAAVTASERYEWRPALWDFAWEYGESLTSGPYRGTAPRGWWLDGSDGSGRAARHNGGMMLDSRYGANRGPGDHGTTWMQAMGNARVSGRWELRLRPWRLETDDRDYRILVELVPADPDAYHCGAQNITVADVTLARPELRIGANALRDSRSWSLTRSSVGWQQTSHALAVEVGKRHVSWFLDGQVIGTVKSAAVVSGEPLSLRLSMIGDGAHEMNHTRAIFDWVRGYSLEHGALTRSGRALKAGTNPDAC